MSADTALEVGRLYAQLKRIADVLTSPQKDVFIRLPGIVAYYPAGARYLSGAVIEHLGSGLPLSQTGTVQTAYDGNSYMHLGNGVNYVSSSGGLGVTGLETYISASIRGLTVGAWFMIDSLPANQGGLVTKWGPVTDYGYGINVNSAGLIIGQVSGTGSSVLSASSAAVSLGTWIFAVLRFTPSAEVAIFVNGDKTVNSTAIPASINVAAQDFECGRSTGDDTLIAHAKCRDVFVCASALTDQQIEELRQASAA